MFFWFVATGMMSDFEKKVMAGLRACGIVPAAVTETHPLGVAVSGGADSVSLLCALVAVLGAEKLRALTVNHNIRAAAESAGDADFVVALCARLGVPVRRAEIAPGKIARLAAERGRGVEEAARFLRYEAFSDFIAAERLIALCLAHNQNDRAETLVMRFLQGSGAEGSFGIARRREQLVRPLLDISRAEIEAYLRERHQDWRTDSTNSDTHYLRNNIRANVIPVLDASVAGWKKAVAAGAEKALDDNDALQAMADGVPWTRDSETLWMRADTFFAQPRAVRRRILFNAFNLLGGAERFPYALVRDIISVDGADGCCGQHESALRHATASLCHDMPRTFSAGGVQITLDATKILVKKCENVATETGFADIIEDGDRVRLVRSVQNGDVIRAKDGSYKAVQKIFSDWKVQAEDKNRIPLVQDVSQAGQPIVAMLGSELGYSDWIVR